MTPSLQPTTPAPSGGAARRPCSGFFLGLAGAAAAALAVPATGQAPAPPGSPALAWEIREGLSGPESAHYDPGSGFVFVSNVSGSPAAKDGEGWLLKATPDGKVVEPKWITGFNAPKGLRARGGRLYVADIDEIVQIEIKTGRVLRKWVVAGAKMLNDVAVDSKGTVYVSDTMGGRIYSLGPSDRDAAVLVQGDDLESPNGLLARDGRLYVAGWGQGLAEDWSTKAPGRVYSLDAATGSRPFKPLTEPLGNLDGLEAAGDGSWLVSDWSAGKVYRVSRKGPPQMILEGLRGSADIGFVPRKRLLIVPRMKEDIVSAYLLPPDKPAKKASP